MAKLELELSDGTIERLRQRAAAQCSTVECLIEESFPLPSSPAQEAGDPFSGLFADEADLIDEIMAEIEKNRERSRLVACPHCGRDLVE